jgi:hypothetical protein
VKKNNTKLATRRLGLLCWIPTRNRSRHKSLVLSRDVWAAREMFKLQSFTARTLNCIYWGCIFIILERVWKCTWILCALLPLSVPLNVNKFMKRRIFSSLTPLSFEDFLVIRLPEFNSRKYLMYEGAQPGTPICKYHTIIYVKVFKIWDVIWLNTKIFSGAKSTKSHFLGDFKDIKSCFNNIKFAGDLNKIFKVCSNLTVESLNFHYRDDLVDV